MSDIQQYESLFPTTFDPAQTTAAAPVDFTDPGILYPNLPTAQKSFLKKYRQNNQYSQQLDTPVYNALQAYDQSRVAQGKSPLSAEMSAKVATAAQQNRAVTPEPEPDFLQAAGNDLTNLLTSLPRLPGQIVKEVQRLPEIPAKIAQIQRTAPNPVNAAGQMLQLPGVNLVPGTYTAGNVLTGNAQELVRHPLFTALDVLPYANKAAKSTKVVKAATAERAAQTAALSEVAGVPIAPKAPNPFRTLMTKTLDDSGAVVNSRVGNATERVGGRLMNTKPGQLAQDAWGPNSRLQARITAAENKKLRDQVNPNGAPSLDPKVNYVREVYRLDDEFADIDVQSRRLVTERLTNPIDATGKPMSWTEGLNDRQLEYGYKIKDLTERSRILSMGDDGVDRLADREWNGSTETFTPRQARRLDRYQKNVDKFAEKVQERQTMEAAIAHHTDPQVTHHLGVISEKLRAESRRQPMAKAFTDAMRDGNYTRAKQVLKGMYKSPNWRQVINQDGSYFIEALDSLDELQYARRKLDKLDGFTEKRLAQRTAKAEKLKNAVVPARFGEIQQAQFKGALKERLSRDFENDPQLQAWMEHVDQGNYATVMDEAGITTASMYDLRKEVGQTIAGLKEAGADPVFMHRVHPNAVKGSMFPKVTDAKVSPSSLKERTLDTTPYIPDMSIALSHQGLEFLQQRLNVEYVDTMEKVFGTPRTELWKEYVPEAQAAKRLNPDLDINYYITNQMKKDGWGVFDKSQYTPAGKSRGALREIDQIMVPDTILRNLERMRNPPKIIATLDPVMNIFRTSVLALSPRWLINNVFGGAMFALAEQPNIFEFLRHLPAARRLVKSGEFHQMPGIGEGAWDISVENVKAITAKATEAEKVAAIYQHSAGRWARQLFDTAAAQRMAKMGKGVVQGSYNINSWFDDMYRADAFLTGKARGLRKGMTEEAAIEQGIAMSRKIMQNWDEITPMERTVLRYVFPFYGFMQHVFRYVMQYPFDHPWRTAVLGSFARNELADMGTGLPQRFLSMAFIGDMDDQGNIKAINLGGTNPFAAVANMYTLGGVLGATNPVISSFAESMGLDPMTGNTSLFPSTTYNPETGQLEAKQRNYFTTLGFNLIPWANTANDVFFDSAEYKKLLQTNPEAAGRKLAAQTGIPMLARNVNIPREIIQAEKNRIEAESKAKGEMLRTGNYEIANQYPGLNAYLGQLQELQQEGGLEQYKPAAQSVPNPLSAAWMAYAGQRRQLQ